MTRQRLIFLGTAVAALFASACGRQVTPNPPGLGPGGTPKGYLAIFFTTSAAFNFSQYQYMVVFNTTGSGVTPSTDTYQTNWAGYSFALMALGGGSGSYAKAYYFVHGSNPHAPPGWLPLGTNPQTLSYNLDANGANTEFDILAQRRIFDYNPSPSPSPSPTASPSNLWTFNAFVAQAQPSGKWYFYDSMGAGGPIDPQYVSPKLCMTEQFDNTYYAQDMHISDPSAQIVTVEIANNPVSPAPCP